MVGRYLGMHYALNKKEKRKTNKKTVKIVRHAVKNILTATTCTVSEFNNTKIIIILCSVMRSK